MDEGGDGVLTVKTDQHTAVRMKASEERNSRRIGFWPRKGTSRLSKASFLSFRFRFMIWSRKLLIVKS